MMKLIDYPLPQSKIKKKYDSSLVINLKKIHYHELKSIHFIFDDPFVLMTPVKGWYPIHYVCFNSDYRVLEAIMNLYKKHHIDLNQLTNISKEKIPENATPMDIVYMNDHVFNFLTLYKNNFKPEYLRQSGIRYALKSHYIDDNSDTSHLVLPYPDNIITPSFYTNSHDNNLTLFFLQENYEDKSQIIDELKENLMYLSLYSYKNKNKTFILDKIDNLLRKDNDDSRSKKEIVFATSALDPIEDVIIEKPIKRNIKQENLDDYLILFFIPVYSLIEYAYQNSLENNSIRFSDISPLLLLRRIEKKGYNIIELLLNRPEMLNEFESYYAKCKSLEGHINEKNFNQFLEFFEVTVKTALALKLESSLEINIQSTPKYKL